MVTWSLTKVKSAGADILEPLVHVMLIFGLFLFSKYGPVRSDVVICSCAWVTTKWLCGKQPACPCPLPAAAPGRGHTGGQRTLFKSLCSLRMGGEEGTHWCGGLGRDIDCPLVTEGHWCTCRSLIFCLFHLLCCIMDPCMFGNTFRMINLITWHCQCHSEEGSCFKVTSHINITTKPDSCWHTGTSKIWIYF